MENAHVCTHEHLQMSIESLITTHRSELDVDPRWMIRASILCPLDASDTTFPHALMTWNKDTFESWLSVRCDIVGDLLEWEVVHELVELSWYRSGTILHDLFYQLLPETLPDVLMNYWINQVRTARNQEVEAIVARYLHCSRPPSLYISPRVKASSFSV